MPHCSSNDRFAEQDSAAGDESWERRTKALRRHRRVDRGVSYLLIATCAIQIHCGIVNDKYTVVLGDFPKQRCERCRLEWILPITGRISRHTVYQRQPVTLDVCCSQRHIAVCAGDRIGVCRYIVNVTVGPYLYPPRCGGRASRDKPRDQVVKIEVGR